MRDRRFVFLRRLVGGQLMMAPRDKFDYHLQEIPNGPVQVSLIWYPASVHHRVMHFSSKLAILKCGVVCSEKIKCQRPVLV
jgi:hypothetical protein